MLTPKKDSMWRLLRVWLRQKRQSAKGPECELVDKHPSSRDRASPQSSASDLTSRPPSYRQQDSKDASPPPYHDHFSGAEPAATCTSALISIVTVTRGSPSVTAQAVADIITYTANSVASAPIDKTKQTAATIVAAISDHAVNVAADPANPSATIRRLGGRNEVGERASIPAFRQGFPEVLGKMNFVIKSIKSAERLPREHVAVAIANAVAAVANAIANAPMGTRMAIAAAYKTSAKHATEVVSKVVRGASWSEMALKNREPAGMVAPMCCHLQLRDV